ncbi:uncharacterized protein BCR38DRAFT_340163 [Pseudomassariella vexata]|uniref:Beta-lactamase superfamily domain-domain-containing protein n=1 Tax=Pseudomassariella vexata TaxID=1141098 RepID=A0A1Y2E394_9PEZI|nr:uncharacterized protein BCR38DRAFT_340163 [Pseudomassariella vexata]ORY66020.1 hypothetical protein BCR38DRAFT_340163 [Pseudomassariella vexata]
MALRITHLNLDASFLLSFEPILPCDGSVVAPRPFTILLDPWISGPSKIFHSRISISTHKHPACIESLSELPEPDLVIVSQHKSDHCNETTLRQLPASGTKTLIVAEPASARLIKSWKYFDRNKIRVMEKWEDPRLTGKTTVVRIPVPAVVLGGQTGEVTVSWIPQKRDLAGLHGAIGITYRPPPSYNLATPKPPIISSPLTPPVTPLSATSPVTTTTISAADTVLLPPSPPVSPHSLRSVQSASTLLPSPTFITNRRPFSSTSQAGNNLLQSPSPSSSHCSRPLSLIFSPHGISYPHLSAYATSHLVSEAALPLTALLHCFDSVTNPWWLGGNICAGAPMGADIATRLGARVWVSAHDGEKEVRGLATGMLRTRRYGREEVVESVGTSGKGRLSTSSTSSGGKKRAGGKIETKRRTGPGNGIGLITEILRLGSGEEVVVCGDGMMWMGTEGQVLEGKRGHENGNENEKQGKASDGEFVLRKEIISSKPLGDMLPPSIKIDVPK